MTARTKKKKKKAAKKRFTKKTTTRKYSGPNPPTQIAAAPDGWWAVAGEDDELFVSPVAVWALQVNGVVGMIDDRGLTSAEAEDDFQMYMYVPDADDVSEVLDMAHDLMSGELEEVEEGDDDEDDVDED